MKPRQSLPNVYIRSGSIYLFSREVLFRQKSLVGKKCYGIILKGKETINIDTYENLNEFKKLMIKLLCPNKKNLVKK